MEAEFLDEVCTSVAKEPNLHPVSGETIRGKTANEARPDGSVRPYNKMFADVKIPVLNWQSYKDQSPHQVYHQHEARKKQESMKE